MAGSAAIGLTIFGALRGARARQKSGKKNRELNEFNARIADVKAEDSLQRGEALVRKFRTDVKKLIGTQRARLAAQGLDVEEGSALDVQADTAALAELDVLTIRNNAAREAWGFRVQATDFRMRGEIAEQTGDEDALGTLITGGAQALFFGSQL